jgi:F-type H+-transporting ATPase subunit b
VSLAAMRKLLPVLVVAMALFVPAGYAGAQTSDSADSAHASASGTQSAGKAKQEQEEDENDTYRHSASVRALGSKLGLEADSAATAFSIANFIVLAGLIGWFLFKTLPKAFRNRSTAIQKHLVDARTATEEASIRLGSVEERLSKLDEQIAEMRAQAEKDSAADEQRIKASVEDEKRKIVEAAEQEITAATAHAQRQIQKYAAELAIDHAARKLVVTAETDRQLVQSFTRRLSVDGLKEGKN